MTRRGFLAAIAASLAVWRVWPRSIPQDGTALVRAGYERLLRANKRFTDGVIRGWQRSYPEDTPACGGKR